MFATVVSIRGGAVTLLLKTIPLKSLRQDFSTVFQTQIFFQGQRSYRHTPSDPTKELQEKEQFVCFNRRTFVFYFPSCCRETDGGDASLQTQK